MSDGSDMVLLSPDGRVEIRFALGDWYAAGQKQADQPLWQVYFAGRRMLRPALLGTAPLIGELDLISVVRHRGRQTWQPACGDAATLLDHYNELVVRLRERAAPQRRLDLVFRCSNQGAAVRVRLPRQRGMARVTLTGAGTVYRFPEQTQGWVAGKAPTAVALGNLPPDAVVPMPLMLNYAHGKLACLLQVGGQARGLQPTRDGLATLADESPAVVKTPYEAPWQVLLLGDTPCALLQNSGWIQALRAAIALRGSAPTEMAVACESLLALWQVPGASVTPAQRQAWDLICGDGAACWDETRYLRGEIGAFLVVARRLGGMWQVAGVTGAEGRILTVRLAEALEKLADRTELLDSPDPTYTLTILRDPLPGEAAEDGMVRETFAGVDAQDKPRLALLPHGGFVLRLAPE